MAQHLPIFLEGAQMVRYAYDIENLKNLFTATFVNVENEKDKHVFYIGLDKEDYSDLLKFLNQEMTLVGYNSINYDDPMLRFIIGYNGKNILLDLNSLSEKLVNDSYRNDKTILSLRYPRDISYPWNSIDLMKILAFDKMGISLKQTAINLKWHKIQDMPIDHLQKINKSQLESILSYNLNDVLITKRLYEEIEPLRKLRDDLSRIYSIDLTSASDSKIANLILENIYTNELKMDIRSIKNMRTEREKIWLKNCIANFVSFKTPELNEMLDRISATIVYTYVNYKYSEKIHFANCIFSLGIGGLHTEDSPGIFATDENYIIQDMDVASYYPNLIINNNFYPKHLGMNFIKVLKKITTERLDAKHKKDKVKSDGLKITVNSIFGKLGYPYFWLYDPKQFLSTTLSGQLGLLMIVEDLYLAGIPVISCNTDGIVCKIPRELEDKYYEITENWEKKTNLKLEFTLYKKYVRRDVNSYITEKEDGHTKEKGIFLKEVDLKKSYRMPIVAKALSAYFIKGVPVRETLEKCKDIMEFCISQKTGNNFIVELHTMKGIEKLQKTNRFYIAKRGGSFIKRQMFTGKLIGLYVGKMVRILNDYDSSAPFESYNVDLAFYEKEVMKIIDDIEPRQISLFDMSDLSNATIEKIEMPKTQRLPIEEIDTVASINKLGKNQLSRKLELMVTNREKITNISTRYVYVMGFIHKTMTADIYCLSKGIKESIVVDKSEYKKTRIEPGQLMFCTKFEKTKNGHILVKYKITDKIEEQHEKLL